jgi:Na+-translocating ferredoxin:NAD+ oxidoreductase RNF subunit RnfB
MEKTKFYAPVKPTIIMEFDPKVCDGCHPTFPEPLCVKACRMDILLPNPEKTKPPIVIYPDECCECGCCVHACPKALEGAIKMNWPIHKQPRWKRKETGEHFRVGMPNPPPPNPKPPVSGWYPTTEKKQ